MTDRAALHAAMDADDRREEAALGACETLAFARGEGVGEVAGGNAERADVLAYLARKKANAQLIAKRTAEFADEARWIARQLDVLTDDIRGGLHEGAAFTAAVLAEGPVAAVDPYPFLDHLTAEQADAASAGANS